MGNHSDRFQLQASLDYAGCPHCGGPVLISTPIERAKHDLLTALLFLLARRPTKAEIEEAIAHARAEAEERLYADHLAPEAPR